MRIISRDEWGARAPEDRTTVPWSRRTGVAVHHVGGTNLGHADEEKWLRNIQAYHMDTRKWSDIGYNHAVGRSGNLYELRGWTVVGAHVLGQNTPNLGVVYLGHSSIDVLTDAAKHTLAWYIAEARRRKNGKLAVRGHGQLASTDCPGGALRQWLAAGMPVPNQDPETTWTEELVMQLPTLSKGANNKGGVQTVQALLNSPRNGGTKTNVLVEDGDWQDKTDARLRAFQVAKKVPESVDNGVGDGVCGEHTWKALLPV